MSAVPHLTPDDVAAVRAVVREAGTGALAVTLEEGTTLRLLSPLGVVLSEWRLTIGSDPSVGVLTPGPMPVELEGLGLGLRMIDAGEREVATLGCAIARLLLGPDVRSLLPRLVDRGYAPVRSRAAADDAAHDADEGGALFRRETVISWIERRL